ncbi:MAG: PAS domain S-box protein [Bradyrhizobium sp.]
MSFSKLTTPAGSPPEAPAVPPSGEGWLRVGGGRLALTYEHAPAGILEIDEAGQILRVNRKVCELMGYEPAELLGRSIFNETSPLDVVKDLVQFRRQVAGEIDGYTIEKRMVRKDGALVWAEVSSSSVCDAHGKFLYAVRVQHDIHARREAETQQRRLLDEIHHRSRNDLELVQSLLGVAARRDRGDETREVLAQTGARMSAIAAAQRARDDGSSVEDYLSTVCEAIRRSLPGDADMQYVAGCGPLPSDAAIPLALVLHELVTNAVRHGERARIRLTGSDGRVSLCVEDDGAGFELEQVRKKASGLQLVFDLAHLLRGTFSVTRKPSRACLDFSAAIDDRLDRLKTAGQLER